MKVVNTVLLILACVSFLLAFLGWSRPYGGTAETPGRSLNLVALGLLFWVLVPTIAILRT